MKRPVFACTGKIGLLCGLVVLLAGIPAQGGAVDWGDPPDVISATVPENLSSGTVEPPSNVAPLDPLVEPQNAIPQKAIPQRRPPQSSSPETVVPQGVASTPVFQPPELAPPAPAPVVRPLVLVFRGLIGEIYSAGMDDLASVLRKRGYDAHSYSHLGGPKAMKLARATNGPIALIGHSAGGTAAIDIARKLDRQGKSVCLLVTLDPVGVGIRVPKNVRSALNFREGVFSKVSGRGDITNVNVRVLHPDLDDDPQIRQRIINTLGRKC